MNKGTIGKICNLLIAHEIGRKSSLKIWEELFFYDFSQEDKWRMTQIMSK